MEPEDDDVDGDGEADDRADAFFKAGPAFLQDGVPAAFPAAICLYGAFHLHLIFTFRTGQDKAADNKDGKGTEDGRAKGEAHIDDGRSLDHRRRDERDRGQVEKIDGHGVEQVGQDQLFSGDLVLLVGLGEHGVGADAGKKCHGEGGARYIGEVPQAEQGAGQGGNLAGPVQGFDQVGKKKADRDIAEQPEQRPDQVVPEREHGGGRKGHGGYSLIFQGSSNDAP